MTDPKPYRHRFPMTLIQHAVWLYHRFPSSCRDVQELLHQRGIQVSHETLREWRIKFAPLFAEDLRHRAPRRGSPWHLDEPGSLSLPTLTQVAGSATSGSTTANVDLNPVSSTGEVRGLQRYTLSGGLQLGRGERLTLPFLNPQARDCSRYGNLQSYFDAQNHSGSVNRHYKFASSQSLPTGPVDVCEKGLLVGSVLLPAVQAGRPVDLDLGTDAELRDEKTVKRLGAEKNDNGKW